MEKELIRHAHMIKILFKADKATRERLLACADKDLVRILCAISKNTVSGKVDLKPKEKAKLQKYKDKLRFLSRRGNWKGKKKVLAQKGCGLIPVLLGPIIGALISKILK